ncbi:hypothetical protein GCU56_19120 [Geodermatophilus sabuli]|uniref:Lipoprotein n=1 Tax=Geodermatophilus sabuli TaxID=1564158 RepID=A0A7K3W5D9_9ACTN|nr:hypothetical protein [Geodermatophilus sabuli]NEK59971.1 hypothetical protein [Geodermatophilus sabuli]
MTSSRPRLAAAAVLAAGLLLGGCGGAPERPAPRPEPTAAASTAPGDDHAELPAAPPSPVDDANSQQAALDAATAAVTAFARPGLDPAQWWSEFAPLLSSAAVVAYEGTDPEQVPASAVTGRPRPTPGVSAFLATVLVPTDAGEYAVLLAREGAGAPWLVERITPVEQAGAPESGALTPPTDAGVPVAGSEP